MTVSYLDEAAFTGRSIMPPDDVAALSRLVGTRSGDAAAADASTEALLGVVRDAGATISAVYFTPKVPVPSSDTDYATITVYKRHAGGAPSAVASATTKTTGGLGALGAGIAVAIPVSSGSVAQGDQITFAITKAGAGVVVPEADLAAIFAPGFVTLKLVEAAAMINARLAKRYKTPVPVVDVVLRWQERLTTLECMLRRGFNPSSEQDAEIVKRAEKADADIVEAADGEKALLELPLLDADDPQRSAIISPAPLGYSEQSPYVGYDRQRETGRFEDSQGRGSSS